MALVGTVAVVLALLWAFGGDLESGDDTGDVAAGESDFDDADEGGSAEGDDGSDGDGDDGDDGGGDDSTTEPPADPVTAPPELRQPLGILNATSIGGLASRAQVRFQEGGWTVPAIGDYSQSIAATTVYYPSGLEESAAALQAQFPEIQRIEPTVPGLAQDRLIVVLAQDYADAVDDAG